MQTFDKILRPQDDFFGYVNNDWLKNNPIPANESVWGTFYVLRNKSSDKIKKIVRGLLNATDDTLTYDQKLIKTFFATALSYPDHRDNHLKTINAELQKIRDIKNKTQIAYYLGYAHRHGFTPFWSNYISVDDKNSQTQVFRIHQSGLCLPNRDYYLDNTACMKHFRKEYKQYFQAVHNLIPDHSPSTWKAIFDIELKIAKSSWTDINLRDVEKNYTRFKIKELQSRFPRFDWLDYFKGQGWKKLSDNIIVDQPSFIDEVLNIIDEYSLEKIKEYLSWHVINNLFNWIDEKTAKINFEFYGKIIAGKLESNSFWKRSILQADDLIIGEILGREYSKRYFSESSKNTVLEIVKDIRSAYHKRIDKLPWMKNDTKKLAHQKLDNIKVLIGYPSTWRNLNKLKFSNSNHIANILSAHSFASDVEISKIGKKPDPKEWYMDAHIVNAYHDPNQLVICFPAAILQPPFYDPDASYATNLGGIGSVIGHELTHGFDDQGGQFDEYGNVNQWQTQAETRSFKKIAQKIIKQANAFEVLPGIFLRGKLIIGEAIADIGGLEIAIEALRTKTEVKDIDKSLRELFINYATFERGSQREEHLICQVKTDPHPPSSFRVNCVFAHIDAFYETYDVRAKDKLYLPPDERAHIW